MIAILVGLLACAAFGQETAGTTFAVASVKPSPRVAGKDYRGQVVIAPDRMSARNVSLKDLIVEAYHLDRYQISGGGAWLDSDEFDIDGRSDAPVSRDQLRLMLRALLADRFRLATHSENRELQVYALVVDKNGPKIRPTKEGSARGSFHGDLRGFAALLSVQLSIPTADDPGRPSMASGSPVPVVDRTGLSGVYDFNVEFRPEAGGDMFTLWQRTLQEQLGLKLERQKTGTEFLVIDGAIRTPLAN